MTNHHGGITTARLVILLLLGLCVAALTGQQRNASTARLLEQFRNEKVFWRQIEVAKDIVALHDTSVLQELTDWLKHEDRHIRGAEEALPRIRELLNDNEKSHVGELVTVAQAAKAAIATLEAKP